MSTQYTTNSTIQGAVSFNQGLRSYMQGIYNYMTAALLCSAAVAYVSVASGLTMMIMRPPLVILVSLAPIAISFYLAFQINKLSVVAVRSLLFVYAGTMGIAMSGIFLIFNIAEIARAFFITSSMFAGMSIYGYTTKKDLTSMGSLMIMAVWGLIVASIIGIFVKSTMFSMLVSFGSVVVFTGLVAYDTQRLKNMYYQLSHSNASSAMGSKLAAFGALQLYIDFVAIFINMLQLLNGGNRK